MINYEMHQPPEGSPLVIYVGSVALHEFCRQMPDTSFILVSGDTDYEVPNDSFPDPRARQAFLEDPRLIRWYAQNCTTQCTAQHHPKLVPIPIGMDYHTMNQPQYTGMWGPAATPRDQEHALEGLRAEAAPFWARDLRCYSNFHFEMGRKYGYERQRAVREIPADLIVYQPAPMPRIESWQGMIHYTFAVSPPGNGMDCHRTWEALLLGCIVVVKTSPLDALYEGLPVLIVQEWSDVSRALLDATLADFRGKHERGDFHYERLRLDYWMARIRVREPTVPL